MIGERTDTELEAFYAEMEAARLEGLWRANTQTPEPRTAVQPHVWRWEEVRQLLVCAGELITVDRDRERRVLELVNPGLGGRSIATHTLIAAVQMIHPGEVAACALFAFATAVAAAVLPARAASRLAPAEAIRLSR